MPKFRSKTIRPLVRKSAGRSDAKAITAKPKLSAIDAGKKKRNPNAAGDKVRLHESFDETKLPIRQMPWWVVPEHQRAHMPHVGTGMMPPHPPGPGPMPPHPPGPGPMPPHPPGPGPFPPHPPGPGPMPPHPPGPGPFPPHPPGPGPFPPHPPFPPGPFPPHPPFPPGPFPPGPFPPFPVPIPIPIPIPGPVPVPVPIPTPLPVPPPYPSQGAFVAIAINGGLTFPGITGTTFVPFFPGMTIRQALLSSGLVTFGPGGFILTVSGITITGTVGVTLSYNGQVIPQTQLDLPVFPNSTIGLNLFYL